LTPERGGVRKEAVVIGGGPAGLLAARELARRGVEVKVFEEHPVIGEPNHCAGILSVEGLQRLDMKPSPDFIQHEIRDGTIYSPNRTAIRIASNRTRAYVVDRATFDRHLADSAQGEGAEIETAHRIRELAVQNDQVVGVIGKADAIHADVVIDGEGAGGSLTRKLGLPHPLEGVLRGVNVEVSGVDLEPHMVEVWLGEKLAPGLFAWVIPTGEGTARCGLACSGGDAYERLGGFLRRRFGEVERSEPWRWPVLTGGPISRTFSNGLLLVGDVAGQTKPTTGGGVILGGLCAIDAGRTAADALEEGDCSASFLGRYERSWRATLGKEFSSMLAARNVMNRIKDERMDRLLDAVKQAGLEDTIEGFVDEGDMDMQSGVLRSALKHPRLLKVLMGSLGKLALMELRVFFNL
jgi:digeranylgeranylglycerophospholipid reductase